MRWFGVRRLLLCERLLRSHGCVLRDRVSGGFRDVFLERPASVNGWALWSTQRHDVRGLGIWRLLL